mgnify:FL=1|jgi:hypothetical protein
MIKTNSIQKKIIETDLSSFKKSKIDFGLLKLHINKELNKQTDCLFLFITEDNEVIEFINSNFNNQENIIFNKFKCNTSSKAKQIVNVVEDSTINIVKGNKFHFFTNIIRGGLNKTLKGNTIFSGKIKPLGKVKFSNGILLIKLASIGGSLEISKDSEAIIDIDIDFDQGFSGDIFFEGNNITDDILRLAAKYQKKFKKIHLSKDSIGHQLKVY